MKELNLTRRARSVIRTATIKDTGIVFAGNTISSVLGAVFYFLLARVAGPAQFGVFAAVTAVATTAVDLFDVGINAAVINYASRIETRSVSLRAAFLRKVWISLIVTLIIILAAPFISGLLGQPVLTGAIRWAAILVPTKALFSFVRAGLQAAKLFFLDAVMDILSSVLRLGLFVVFIFGFSFESVWAAILSWGIGLFLPAAIASKKIWRMMGKSGNNIIAPGFTSYQSYMTAAFAVSAISGRLDVFFLTRLTSLETVGWYQAAFRLFMPVQQLSSSLSRVLAPRFAGFGVFRGIFGGDAMVGKIALFSFKRQGIRSFGGRTVNNAFDIDADTY